MTINIEELKKALGEHLSGGKGVKTHIRWQRNGISFTDSKEYYEKLQEKFNKNEFNKNTQENLASKLDLASAYILGQDPFEKNEFYTKKGEIILRYLWDKCYLPAFIAGAKFYMEGKIIPKTENQNEQDYKIAMFQKVLALYSKAMTQSTHKRFKLNFAEHILHEFPELSTPDEKKKAIDCLLEIGKENNEFSGIAYYNLGLYYRDQNGPSNMQLALKYFEEAAKCEKQSVEIVFSVQSESAFEAARIYHYSLGNNCDIVMAIRYYQLASDKNHPGALISYGNLLRLGQELPKDREKAKQVLLKGTAFSDSHDKNQVYHGLGAIYLEEGDLSEAERCLKLAVKLGNHGAKLDLAVFYLKKSMTKTVSQNKPSKHKKNKKNNHVKEAVQLLTEISKLATEKQYSDIILHANFLLANCLYEGWGMIQDKDRGLKSITQFVSGIQNTLLTPRITDQHRLNVFNVIEEILKFSTIPSVTAELAYTLGYAYFLGLANPDLHTQESNTKNAFELFNQAAALGHSKAMRHLALCYQYGRGVKKDEPLAREYWKKLAARQDKQAYRVLGEYCLVKGEIEKGLDLLRKGQDREGLENLITAPIALYNLARAYKKGEAGLKQNFELACQIFQMAFERKDMHAALELGEMYRYGCGEVIKPDLIKARKFYLQAYYAKLLSAQALKELDEEIFQTAENYQQGKGVERDLVLAEKLYKILDNHDGAKLQLGIIFELHKKRSHECAVLAKPKQSQVMGKINLK